MATKNIFAKIGADDSDEDFEPKPMTKTTKKKEERKIAIDAARNAAKAKVKANKVAPSPNSPRSPEDAGEKLPLKHTGDLPPVPGTPQAEPDVEQGDKQKHHEHELFLLFF